MAVTADALDVILRVQNLRGFQRGMSQASAATREVGAASRQANAESEASSKKGLGLMGLMRKASGSLALTAAAAGFEAYKLGVGFDKQLTMIQTQAGATSAEVGLVRHTILGMKDAIADPTALARAAYFIESVGQRGSRAMKTLHAASDGAAMGNANVVDTAQTLAGIMKVGLPGAMTTANGVMAQVNATVGAGAMTLEDYNHAMGTGVLPVAKEYGITFQDINAALAIFTDEHITGSSAMAQFATSFHFLVGATKTGEAALHKIGLTGLKMAQDLRNPRIGLRGALNDLHDHLIAFSADPNVQNAIMNTILPGGRGRILHVLMNQAVGEYSNYSQKIKQINSTTGNYARNLAIYHTTAAYKIHHAWNQVQVTLIHLYDVFKNQGTSSILAIIAVIITMIHFLTFLAAHLNTILGIVGPLAAAWIAYKLAVLGVAAAQKILTGGAMVKTFLSLAASEGLADAALIAFNLTMLASPIFWIPLAIAAVVGAIIFMIIHWKQVKEVISSVLDWIKAHWLFVALVFGPVGIAFALIFKLIWHFKGVFSGLGGFVGNVFKGIVHGVIWGINQIIKFIDFVIRQYNKIPSILRPTGKIGRIDPIGDPWAPKHLDVSGFPRLTATPNQGPTLTRSNPIFREKSTTPATLGQSHDRPIIVETHSHLHLGKKEIAKSVNRYNVDDKARK